jgi:hypothetical protein
MSFLLNTMNLLKVITISFSKKDDLNSLCGALIVSMLSIKEL